MVALSLAEALADRLAVEVLLTLDVIVVVIVFRMEPLARGDCVELLVCLFDAEAVELPVIVLVEARLRDPVEDPVDVLETVIDPVLVGVFPIVTLSLDDGEEDGEAVAVLDGRTVAVSELLALEVLDC